MVINAASGIIKKNKNQMRGINVITCACHRSRSSLRHLTKKSLIVFSGLVKGLNPRNLTSLYSFQTSFNTSFFTFRNSSFLYVSTNRSRNIFCSIFVCKSPMLTPCIDNIGLDFCMSIVSSFVIPESSDSVMYASA